MHPSLPHTTGHIGLPGASHPQCTPLPSPGGPAAPKCPGSHFFSGKPLPLAGMVLGAPLGGWGCWCWRRAGSVLEGKAQVLVKSTSLGRPGSRLAGLAKLGSRRPLHRLSSDSVRCRLFWGDCSQDRWDKGSACWDVVPVLGASWQVLTHPVSTSVPLLVTALDFPPTGSPALTVVHGF